MTTATPITTSSRASTVSPTELVRVLQFGDSVLPVGAFSFSGGLESAVQAGIVHDLATLKEFIRTATEQAASSDGVAVLAAQRAAATGDQAALIDIDRAVYNRKLNEELRTMSVRMGCKLAEMAVHVFQGPSVQPWLNAIKAKDTPGTYPVAQGIVFADLGLAEYDAFAVHQYGLTSMMTGAALRLMRVHYLDVQTILFEINSQVADLYERVCAISVDDMQAFAPTFDILAAQHVKAHVRMFMN